MSSATILDANIPPSPFSSSFRLYQSWTAADVVVCSGAAAIDVDNKKVLLLRDSDGVLFLPWCRDFTDDVGEFVDSPFEQLAKETGYRFEKLPCRLPGRIVKPLPDNDKQMCSFVNLGRQATVDPFYMSFDVLWTKLSEKWYDAHQRMTLWFVCTAHATDAAARTSNQAVWMTLADAQAQLATQGRRSLPDCAALKQLEYLWPR